MKSEDLIAELARSATPVRRLASPMKRALLWLGAIAALYAFTILTLANLQTFAVRLANPRLAAELLATLATGIAGVIAAFHLSVPDRSRAWALLPLPFALLWIALSGIGCWQYWAEQTANGWRLGESAHCFGFLIAVALPLAGLLLVGLRRSRPLQPRLVALIGTMGVAALAAFLLQFFHPFDVTLMDFGVHLTALGVLVAVSTVLGQRTLT